MDRRDRLAAPAQLAPRVALREQDRAEHVEPLLAVRVDACVRAGFVDRLPPEHEIAERLRAERDVAGPEVGAGPVVDEPAAHLGEPARQGEVVQAHPGRHSRGTGRGQHLEVVLDGAGVAPAFLGLDARPFDRETMVREPVLGVELEVFGEAFTEAVPVAADGHLPGAFEGEPVGCGRRALGLGR